MAFRSSFSLRLDVPIGVGCRPVPAHDKALRRHVQPALDDARLARENRFDQPDASRAAHALDHQVQHRTAGGVRRDMSGVVRDRVGGIGA
jgi:hypothetical protein